MSHVDIWMESILGREISKCKGSGVGAHPACLGTAKPVWSRSPVSKTHLTIGWLFRVGHG
jgi:hypothetical protein